MSKIYDANLVAIILEEMRECVESDNFVLVQTEKNKAFISEYALSRNMQKELLLAINVEDYFNSSESRNFSGRYVHEFCPNIELCAFDGNSANLSVYVKFELEEVNPDLHVVVISLHLPEYPVCYPFIDKK